MPKLSGLKNSLRFRLSLMAAVLVFGSVPLVPESWWGSGIQGDCSNAQPKGASWLNWTGYAFMSWGKSEHLLSWHDGQSWQPRAGADSGHIYGVTNTALANSSAGYVAGQWRVSAVHSANYIGPGTFPMRVYANFTC